MCKTICVEDEYSLRIIPSSSLILSESARITATATPPRPSIGRKKANTLPDISEGVIVTLSGMMQCLSRAVWYEIKSNEFEPEIPVDVFCEDPNLLTPSMSSIQTFFTRIFNTKKLSVECAVTAVAYVDKLKKISGVKLNRTNWRRLCFIAILEADKVLRDKLVWNEDYKDIIPGIDLTLLRKLEREFLKYIQFTLNLTQSDYAIYLFDLLSLRKKEDDQIPEKSRKRQRMTSFSNEML